MPQLKKILIHQFQAASSWFIFYYKKTNKIKKMKNLAMTDVSSVVHIIHIRAFPSNSKLRVWFSNFVLSTVKKFTKGAARRRKVQGLTINDVHFWGKGKGDRGCSTYSDKFRHGGRGWQIWTSIINFNIGMFCKKIGK